MASLISSADFVSLMGGTGSYRPAAVTTSLILAEGDVEDFLGHGLVPKQTTEEYPWPGTLELIMLKKKRLITVDTVTALHLLECDCVWQTRADCAVIYDGLHGIVRPLDCAGWPCCSGGCWSGCRCPSRVQITYTHGFGATELKSGGILTDLGYKVASAVSLQALHYLQNVLTLASQGDHSIGSWSAAGYSESRNFEQEPGATRRVSPLSHESRNILRDGGLVVKRNVALHGKRGL